MKVGSATERGDGDLETSRPTATHSSRPSSGSAKDVRDRERSGTSTVSTEETADDRETSVAAERVAELWANNKGGGRGSGPSQERASGQVGRGRTTHEASLLLSGSRSGKGVLASEGEGDEGEESGGEHLEC